VADCLFLAKFYLVSHSRLRNEANCLNCDTEVIGRFCHVCGQENIEPHESFWSLLTHFVNDFTHFDGKFFKTVGYLLSKPGFLPAEYSKGRRARYLHPIRMYLFTSAVFFLIFYSYMGKLEVNERRSTAPIEVSIIPGLENSPSVQRDTVELNFLASGYPTVAAYDSIQRTLPREDRDGWISRLVVRRSITMNNRYKDNAEWFVKDLLNGLVHSLPSLLFVSLPIFALLLKLLYARRNFVYADHAIFLVFLYIFLFLLFLLQLGVHKLSVVTGMTWVRYLLIGVSTYIVVYSFIGMKRFYGQGWGKTLVKFSIFNLLGLFVVIILFVVFLLLTFFRV
jgi:hypothetical protein